MKYIKPPEFKSVREFTKYYKKVEKQITEILETGLNAKTSEEYGFLIEAAMLSAISYLTKVNKRFTEKELPKAFKEGKDSVKEPIKLSKAEASEILKKQGFKYAEKAFSRDTYIELQSAVKSAGEGLKERINGIIETLKKENKDSVYNVQQEILKDLQRNGLLNVEYKNGAKQPLEAYAAMAARSARIESINIGAIGRALQTGTDYVKMTTMPQCCKFCGAYQDKVYCVSGKDKRFPALFQTVLKSGYALPHPNCRHEFIPWYPEMESPKDVEQAIKDSKIKYNKDGSLVDVRYQKDIEAYANWQRGNRQRNAEQLEFQKMQAYYAEKDVDPPYKTIGAFRRARRSNNLSPAYLAWRNRKRDEKQYEEWIKIIGRKNMPESLEKFGELKYNREEQQTRRFDLLRQYKETVESGKVSNIGFEKYENVLKEANKKIIGIKTSDGSEIEHISKHLIDRIIGSDKKKRAGVSIDKIVETLEHGTLIKEKVDTQGRRSQIYHFKGVDVTYNPDTNTVIQCQPNTHRKVKK